VRSYIVCCIKGQERPSKEKRRKTKAPYTRRSPKKKVPLTLFYFYLFIDFLIDFFNRVFGRFVRRGVQERGCFGWRVFLKPWGAVKKNKAT
jgi:hypothetical protein